METQPHKVFHKILDALLKIWEKILDWKWWLQDLRRSDGHGIIHFLTDNALRSYEINVETLKCVVKDLDEHPRNPTHLPIDPLLCLNKLIEGLWGEMRRHSYTFNAYQFAVLTSRMLHLRQSRFSKTLANHDKTESSARKKGVHISRRQFDEFYYGTVPSNGRSWTESSGI